MPIVKLNDKLMGSSTYYPGLANQTSEVTYNWLVNDDALVTLPTYYRVNSLVTGVCRCVYFYSQIDAYFVIVDSSLYLLRITSMENVSVQLIGYVSNDHRAAFIAGNQKEEILILSNQHVYFYSFKDRVFSEITVEHCSPCYLSFNLGQFILTDQVNRNWRLSDIAVSTSFPIDSSHVMSFQDNSALQAVVSNNQSTGSLLLLSDHKSQFWAFSSVKPDQFPYFLVSGSDSSYGCYDAGTIVPMANYVIWVTRSSLNRYAIAIADLKGASLSFFDKDGLSDYLTEMCPGENLRADKFSFFGDPYYVLHFLNKGISLLIDLKKRWYHISQDYLFSISQEFMIDLKGNINKLVNNPRQLLSNKIVHQSAERITSPVFFDKGRRLKQFRLNLNNIQINSADDNQLIVNYSKNGGTNYFGSTRVFLPRINETGVVVRKNSLGLCKAFSMKIELLNAGCVSLSNCTIEVE